MDGKPIFRGRHMDYRNKDKRVNKKKYQTETVEEFLARGGQIRKVEKGDTVWDGHVLSEIARSGDFS